MCLTPTPVPAGFYTVPHWDELVAEPIAEASGRLWLIALMYLLMVANNALHNAAWFLIVELEGGTSTGLLMGVKAVFLFFGSAIAFCSAEHPEQCMTPLKVCAPSPRPSP